MQASEVRSLKWEVGIFYPDPDSAKTVGPTIILRFCSIGINLIITIVLLCKSASGLKAADKDSKNEEF